MPIKEPRKPEAEENSFVTPIVIELEKLEAEARL